MNAQADLFSGPLVPLAPAQKLFRGANGVGLPYWEQDGKITQVALSDKLILPVTHQKGGHIYANDPGEWGRIERKNKISFLSAAAQIRRAIEINNSMQDSLKEQEKWLHGALEIRPVPPTVQRQHARKKDVAQESSNLIYANPFQDHSKNFGNGPDWLLQRRDLRPIEKLIYARLLFPMKICEQWDQELGVIIELDQAELAKSLGINRSTVNKWLVSLQLKAWIICNGNPGAKQTVRFLWKEGMPETCRHVPTGFAANAVADANSTCRTSEQQPVGTCSETCATRQQVSEAIEKRERTTEEENAQLSDVEWLRTVVQAKFPRWPLEQLKLQWHQHRRKGKEEGKWIPGDRGHFLVAWMPRAGDPPSSLNAIAEPPWWGDFMSECYPDAPTRDFCRIQKLQSGLTIVREGFEWAASRAIPSGGA